MNVKEKAVALGISSWRIYDLQKKEVLKSTDSVAQMRGKILESKYKALLPRKKFSKQFKENETKALRLGERFHREMERGLSGSGLDGGTVISGTEEMPIILPMYFDKGSVRLEGMPSGDVSKVLSVLAKAKIKFRKLTIEE